MSVIIVTCVHVHLALELSSQTVYCGPSSLQYSSDLKWIRTPPNFYLSLMDTELDTQDTV